jgi:hypothetical protein
MSVIISTMAIKKKFFVAVSKQIIIDEWLTPNTIPCDEKTIISLVRKITLKKENVIIISKYGKRAPADFPKICTEGLLSPYYFIKHIATYQTGLTSLEVITRILQIKRWC